MPTRSTAPLDPRHARFQRMMAAVVPSFLGWRTYFGAVGNLIIFGLVVVAGEWLVHEIEYAFEYGRRFGAVMGTTPHRYYMVPAGILLALLLGGLAAQAGIWLSRAELKRRWLLKHVPDRLLRRMPVAAAHVSARRVGVTAAALAFCQVALYVLQENLESAAIGNGWLGLRVIAPPIHTTVMPFHFLVAMASAFVMWTIHAWVTRSRRATQIARVLHRIASSRSAPPRLRPGCVHVPNLRLITGARSLRSPPLTA